MDFTLFQGIFEQNHCPPNQRTAVGFFWAFLDVPFSTERGCNFLLLAMAYIKRNNLATIYEGL
eukprot:14984126-Alexandrium_andersonii.AAC.1